MAKFKYRMQSILNVKMKLEVQAKQELTVNYKYFIIIL